MIRFCPPIKPPHANIVELELTGDYALFSDPVTRVGGEKCSYQIPTYEAIKGVLESVYWKPTLIWFIDEVRVCTPIQTEAKGIRPLNYDGGSDLAYYTYLKDVRYQVRAHFEWNGNYPQFERDRNEGKHYEMAKYAVKKGGRRDIFLGTRECQGYVEPCVFGEGDGAYDHIPEMAFGLMFHGYTYPNEAYSEETAGKMTANFWRPVMKNGVITFPRPEECVHKTLRQYPFDDFKDKKEDAE